MLAEEIKHQPFDMVGPSCMNHEVLCNFLIPCMRKLHRNMSVLYSLNYPVLLVEKAVEGKISVGEKSRVSNIDISNFQALKHSVRERPGAYMARGLALVCLDLEGSIRLCAHYTVYLNILVDQSGGARRQMENLDCWMTL